MKKQINKNKTNGKIRQTAKKTCQQDSNLRSEKQKQEQKPNLLPCGQSQCSFGIGKLRGCRACEECGAPPNLINEKCERCFACENKAGHLRWGDQTGDDENKQIEIVQVIN